MSLYRCASLLCVVMLAMSACGCSCSSGVSSKGAPAEHLSKDDKKRTKAIYERAREEGVQRARELRQHVEDLIKRNTPPVIINDQINSMRRVVEEYRFLSEKGVYEEDRVRCSGYLDGFLSVVGDLVR